MSCTCNSRRSNVGGAYQSEKSPYHSTDSPQRDLDPSIFPRSGTQGDKRFNVPKINIPANCREAKDVDTVRPMDTSCVSLEHRRRAPCDKPLSPKRRKPRCPARGPEPLQEPPPCRKVEEATVKRSKKLLRGGRRTGSHRSGQCATGDDVRVPCNVAMEDFGENSDSKGLKNRKIAALEKTLSKTQWHDQDGYHSASISVSQIYHPDSEKGTSGKPCSSDKRRYMLKAKLRELVSETEPIPESCLQESAESKPEPEILAEVLLMSEAEGIDLAEVKPRNVFDNLFSDMTLDRSITVSNAAPESMGDIVVPVDVTGYQTSTFDMPNSETMIERSRTTAPPNLNAFQNSAVYESFSNHMTELLNRTPTNQNISELLGGSRLEDDTDRTSTDYFIKPGLPAHANRVQLNGTVKPSWFSGYVFASPVVPGCIKMCNDPGEALKEAWRLCQPRYFEDQSRYLVNVG